MIKMIFCDMDGTLLDENGNLPPDFALTMARLKERGAMFCPASGRQYTALLTQLAPYKDDFIFISENGTCVTERDTEIFSSPIPKDKILAVLQKVKAIKGAFPILCAQKVCFAEPIWRPYTKAMDIFFTRYEIVSSLEETAKRKDCPEIVKVAIAAAAGGDAEEFLYPPLLEFEPALKVVLSSNYWVDVQMPGINKGVAALEVAKRHDVKPDECLAFGDYLNDYEMVKMVGMGYAMANAHPDVIAAAKYIAPSNAEYGVTKTINALLDAGVI